jgi:hypothetical protein
VASYRDSPDAARPALPNGSTYRVRRQNVTSNRRTETSLCLAHPRNARLRDNVVFVSITCPKTWFMCPETPSQLQSPDMYSHEGIWDNICMRVGSLNYRGSENTVLVWTVSGRHRPVPWSSTPTLLGAQKRRPRALLARPHGSSSPRWLLGVPNLPGIVRFSLIVRSSLGSYAKTRMQERRGSTLWSIIA